MRRGKKKPSFVTYGLAFLLCLFVLFPQLLFAADIPSPDNRYFQYQVILKTTDEAETPVLKSVTVAYDPDVIGPIGSVVINGGNNYTNSRDATLTISATDDHSGLAQMKLSSSPTLAGASWQAYATSLGWTLFEGDGTKTVYIKFKDNAGNESQTYSDDIVYDATPPEAFNLISPTNNAYSYPSKPTLTFERTTDATSGLSYYTLIVDSNTYLDNIPKEPSGGSTGTYENADFFASYSSTQVSVYAKKDAKNFSDGAHTWTARAEDNATNQTSANQTNTLNIDTNKDIIALSKDFQRLGTGALTSFSENTTKSLANIAVKSDKLNPLPGALGIFTKPSDLLYLIGIILLTYFSYLLIKAAQYEKEEGNHLHPKTNGHTPKGYLTTLKTLLKQHLHHSFLTIYYLFKKPQQAFSYVQDVSQKGTWHGSYLLFKRNRRITYYTLASVILMLIIEVTFANTLPNHYDILNAADGDPSDLNPGEEVTFTINYQNTGTHNATDIEFSDILSSSFTYQTNSLFHNGDHKTDREGDDGMRFDSNQNTVILSITTLTPGTSGSFSFKVNSKDTIKKGTAISNRAQGHYNPDSSDTVSNTVNFNAEASGKIAGIIFKDYSQSGTQSSQSQEPGIQSTTIRLYEDQDQSGTLAKANPNSNNPKNLASNLAAADPLVAIATTDNLGQFEFTEMSAGFYFLEVDTQTLPAGYALTSQNNPAQVVLTSSIQEYTDALFGFLPPAQASSGGPDEEQQATEEEEEEAIKKEEAEAEVLEEEILEEEAAIEEELELAETAPDVILKATKEVFKSIEELLFGPKEEGEKTIVESIVTPIEEAYKEVRTNNTIQATNKAFLAPVSALLVTSSVAMTAPLASTAIPLLQYAFQLALSPFGFFSRRRIKKWGVVYDSMTKEPIDLAIIRLVDLETNKVIETKVTGPDGKYLFLVDSNKKYQIEVQKDNYNFPSKYLKELKQDEVFDDLYTGGAISFSKEPDVPTEPTQKPPATPPVSSSSDSTSSNISSNGVAPQRRREEEAKASSEEKKEEKPSSIFDESKEKPKDNQNVSNTMQDIAPSPEKDKKDFPKPRIEEEEEEEEVKETKDQDVQGYIAKNIPLDLKKGTTFVGTNTSRPIKTSISNLSDYTKKSFEQVNRENEKILRQNLYRKISKYFAYLGPIITFISYLITPSNLILALFFINILLLIIFRRLGTSHQKLPYGSVFERSTKKKLKGAIIRLFDPKHGRLVSTKVTDSKGRYGILAKKQEYILTAEKEHYKLPKKQLDIKPKEGYVHEDLGMERKE